MRNRTRKSQGQGETIDLTPMLDVVFIMLIFFIVTASFIKLPGVEVTKVDTTTEDSYKKVGILVAVSENNEYWIDKKRVETTALKINLTRLFNENPKGGMVIQADNESNIEAVAKVADIARYWYFPCGCFCRKRLS
jgi:biopolymer transport protein ExbD